MKQVTFFIALFLIFLTPAFATTTVMQGTGQSSTSVTTHIEGSGSVHTHIESTVNGNTKTLDSNKPGTYTLNDTSSTNSAHPRITPYSTSKKAKVVVRNSFWANVQAYFQKLFISLHFTDMKN